MKIKNQPGMSRSGSPAVNSLPLTNLNDDSHSASNHASYSNLTGSANSQLMTSTSNSTQIWTRSAVRAAQQQKLNDSSLCHKHHKHHGQNQHVIGKIVKPIPVRPMSSSSSSSSTHSSQFNAKSIHSNLSNLTETVNAQNDSASKLDSSNQNFSLIAKYFASFPATRLAKTTQFFSETTPNFNTHSSSEINTKSTPFLPFKKSASINNHNNSNSTTNSNNDQQVHSTFVLRSQTASNLTNTDHLCTNFRRMIKLNESEYRVSPNIIRNTSPAAHTPIGSEQVQFNHINFNSVNDTNDQYGNLQLPINSDSINSGYNQENDSACYLASNDEDTTTRLGQITMETRSTRKFLIKHHPYLQHNLSSPGGLNSSKNLNQRPSINLMKKLNSKNLDEPVNISSTVDYSAHTGNSSSNNRSGRSSRSNNSGLNDQNSHGNTDHNLLKFTDTAPVFSASNSKGTANTNAKQAMSNSMKRRQAKSLTTASALSTELNQNQNHNQNRRLQTRSQTNKNYNRMSSDSQNIECCDCDCYHSDYNEDLHDNSCEHYYDEQEEDSSGYYSSYHSVDLISSSGGSCVGGHHISNRHPKNWEVSKLEDETRHTRNNSLLNTDLTKTNNTSNNVNNNQANTSSNSLIPQHHYHTRYLTHCLEQKQDMQQQQQQQSHTSREQDETHMSHANINTKNIILPVNSILPNITSNSSIPTTRLRYQQQLAAQAANKFSNHLECDLDLDQIEND